MKSTRFWGCLWVLCMAMSCGQEPMSEAVGGEGQPCFANDTCFEPYECIVGFCREAREQEPDPEPVEPTCEPNCLGRECGLDPVCGMSCGVCQEEESCSGAGLCEALEQPVVCGPDRQPPPGMQRAQFCRLALDLVTQSVDCRYWEGFWGEGATNFQFPGGPSLRHFVLYRDSYVAMEFRLDDPIPPGASAFIGYEGLQHIAIPFGEKMFSISRCPGDFNHEAITAELGSRCLVQGRDDRFTFGGSDLNAAGFGGCVLESGETYYLNVIYTSSPAGTPNDQITWDCRRVDPITGEEVDSMDCGDQFQMMSAVGW